MDSTCFICYEDGDILIDPHWRPGTLSRPKHMCHTRCFSTWEEASKEPVRRCPYCMNPISDVMEFYRKNEERRPVINAIKEKDLERFKRLLNNHETIDAESRHLYLVEATITEQISFLEFIEEKYSLPYKDLSFFLAVTLSMRSRKLYRWYWKAYDKRGLCTSASGRRRDFDCQVLVAADIAKKKWLSRWLRFRIALRSRYYQILPDKSIFHVTKFGRSRFTLRRASKFGGGYVTKQEYLEHIVPEIVADEIGWKQAYWSMNSYFIQFPEIGPNALASAVAAANLGACQIFFPGNYNSMKGGFKASDVEHLFGFRGKKAGQQIFQNLCFYKLVDMEDLRKNKIRLCKMSYQASNDKLTKFFLSVLGECLDPKEIEAIHETLLTF